MAVMVQVLELVVVVAAVVVVIAAVELVAFVAAVKDLVGGAVGCGVGVTARVGDGYSMGNGSRRRKKE